MAFQAWSSDTADADATAAVRSFFIGGTLFGVALYNFPSLSKNIVSYGSRAHPPNDNPSKTKDPTASNGILDFIRHGVPHSWFIHYYILTVALSVFWGFQLMTKGQAFLFISQYVDTSDAASSMRPQQTMLVWLLMLAQGIRRLLETIAFTRPSASRMPWSIWLIGVAYYLFMSVAVWIEGTKAILETPAFTLALPVLPRLRTTAGLIVFTLAYGIQHDCHAYLADLKKYTLPEHPAFQRIISPHYTAELVLYIALAFIAAPNGHWINLTLICNVIWVLVNLGIVADETKAWSVAKFGKERVQGRARMIPGVW